MILQDLFDELLSTRSVQVVLASPAAAETLRVTLSKKWNKYKEDMDSLGFLADDLVLCSLGRRMPTTPGGPYTFTLAPRLRNLTNYEVVQL